MLLWRLVFLWFFYGFSIKYDYDSSHDGLDYDQTNRCNSLRLRIIKQEFIKSSNYN